ncbi:MAG: TonB-dependent receptor plug domain-containing protein, partial [Flavitalea sp.]
MKIRKRLSRLAAITVIAMLFCTNLFAQEAVTGYVRATTGEPLEATITVKGSTTSTTSDSLGNFSINAAAGQSLLVSAVGYKEKEIKLSAANIAGRLVVEIEQADNALSEVVVTGYGTQKKGSLTGAISNVTAKDLDRVHAGATVSSGLAGKIPGVSFRMPDGRPGASANIQIRNMGNVLYVIDGIQQDAGQFNNIAPNDIESISVLKDASAAIYGVRAANGVVVVTTKRGKTGPARVSVDGYYGMQNWSRFPNVTNNSYDYMRYRADAELNSPRQETNITDAELEKYRQGTELGYQSFDWRDFIIEKNAPLSNISANVTGGNESVKYYVSATKLYQNSVLGREFKFDRTNFQ